MDILLKAALDPVQLCSSTMQSTSPNESTEQLLAKTPNETRNLWKLPITKAIVERRDRVAGGDKPNQIRGSALSYAANHRPKRRHCGTICEAISSRYDCTGILDSTV